MFTGLGYGVELHLLAISYIGMKSRVFKLMR